MSDLDEHEDTEAGGMDDPMRRVTDLSHWRYFFMAEEDRRKMDAWMRNGKCFLRGTLNEVFNPPLDDEGSESEKVARMITVEAKKYCNGTVDGMRCSMRKECLAYAIDNRIHYGVWGGMTVRERRRVAAEEKL
jgi:hypothetical protein